MKPTIEKATLEGDRYEHPAFGAISLHNYRGGDGQCFMSNVKHPSRIAIVIHTAVMDRRLSHDDHHAKERIIEVEMTPVQWAEFVSSVGQGSGVPCTIKWDRDTGMYPSIDMDSENARNREEIEIELKGLASAIRTVVEDTRETLVAARVSKPKIEAILAPMNALARTLGDRLPFARSMMDESIERAVHEAKKVVEAHASGLAGIDRAELPHIEVIE